MLSHPGLTCQAELCMMRLMPQRIKTEEITGIQDPEAWEIAVFLQSVPSDAVLQLKGSKYIPEEHGTEPWSITATWKEGNL